MLRMIFGEEPRKDEGLLKDAMNAMDKYLVYVRQEIAKDGDPNHRYRQLEIWTVGLKTSLDELEQSLYVADRFADRRAAHAVFLRELHFIEFRTGLKNTADQFILQILIDFLLQTFALFRILICHTYLFGSKEWNDPPHKTLITFDDCSIKRTV